jgi:Protein of unknown function, DUF481
LSLIPGNFIDTLSLMKRTKPIACLLLLILVAIAGKAQIINIDKTDTSDYTKKADWNGNVSLDLEVDKQKSTLFDASNFLNISLQKLQELFILSASDRFTYNGPNSYLNKGYVHLRWRHHYKEQLHPETYVQYQWDDGLGMLHRFVAGENLRYNFWHHHAWEMTVATGIMYEDELWNYTAVDSSKIPLQPVNQKSQQIKWNNYIKWEGKISATSDISIIVFYQAAFNDFFKPRISGVINFNTEISKHFALGIKYNGLYDAGPVVPIFKFYYNYSTGLVYKF